MTTPTPAQPPAPPLRPLDYHAQRLRHTQVLLARWMRRWAVFLATGLLLLAAGASNAWHIASTVVGGLVAPLLLAAQHPAWAPPLLAAYTLLGCAPVLATRALWWPRRWAEAERALPLHPAVLQASDRRLRRGLMAPLQTLLWAGLAVLAWEQGRVQPVAVALAACTLAASGAAAGWCSARWMHHLRQRQAVLHHDQPSLASGLAHATAPQAPHQPGTRPHVAAPTGLATPRVAWPRALLWWPLWRGLARRTARGLVLASLATPALAAAPLAAPAATGWWLAALALLSLSATAWLRARSEAELQSRWPRLCHLPVHPARWQAARRGLTLAPLGLATLVGLVATGPAVLPGAHLGPWLGYWAVLLAGAGLEALPPPRDAGHHAARALLCLALAIALGSEVGP